MRVIETVIGLSLFVFIIFHRRESCEGWMGRDPPYFGPVWSWRGVVKNFNFVTFPEKTDMRIMYGKIGLCSCRSKCLEKCS